MKKFHQPPFLGEMEHQALQWLRQQQLQQAAFKGEQISFHLN